MHTVEAPAQGKEQKTDVTKDILVNVILDRSGSMQICRSGTIEGYNEYLKALRADKDSNYSVTLVQFDSPISGPELTVSYTDKPLADVQDLNRDGYQPRGNTPLFDAIGECCRRVEAKNRGVFTVIITDGHENASTEFDRDSIRALIKQKESEGWKFVFLGANIDSIAVGGSIGIAAADCANYVVGNEKELYSSLGASNARYSSAVRSHGFRSFDAVQATAFTGEERSSMTGGRPAVPPSFWTGRNGQPGDPKTRPEPQRKWNIRG